MYAINDPIHGTIELDEIEGQVIDHPYFQRLRKVKALGFLEYVFPSARHSRFEHSIGACHVAGQILTGMIQVSKGLMTCPWRMDSEMKPLNKEDMQLLEEKQIRRALRLAALLHDCGHGPFSHASECLMPSRKQLVQANNPPQWLRDALHDDEDGANSQQADHEDYTLLIAWSILKDILSDDEVRLVCAIKDTNVTLPDSFKNMKSFSKVLHEIVDGELDADRMDYLRRDSLFCGVPYGNFDFDRLVGGLCILHSESGFVIGIKRSAISSFEHFLFARFQMHIQVYTHRIDAACNQMFKNAARNTTYRLPADLDKFCDLNDENILKIDDTTFHAFKGLMSKRKLWKVVFESYVDEVLIKAMSGSPNVKSLRRSVFTVS